MLLVTLEDQTRPSLYLGSAPEKFVDAVRVNGQQLWPMPVGTAKEPFVPVIVNKGRWIARCPFCRGAEHASEDDHRFFCGSCGNRAVNGMWLPTIWPDDAEGIEEILIPRPQENQNWELSETLDDLRAENIEHGIPA